MRYQKAKQLTEIIPLLYSPDREVVLMGATMLKEHFIIKNLNKYYKQRIHVRWPGWSDTCPEKLKINLPYTFYQDFSKNSLDKLFIEENERQFNILCLTIIAWIYDYCTHRGKREYSGIISYLFHGHIIDEHKNDYPTHSYIERSKDKTTRRTKKKKRSKSEINMLNRSALIEKSKKQIGMSNLEEKARKWLFNHLNNTSVIEPF